MKLKMFQVDAFAGKAFEGNPAAVVPLEEWLPDALMQSIAEENNLSETVFFVPQGAGFHIRWFTPNTEVRLCGHATLAAAFVVFNFTDYQQDSIVFDSLSGELAVSRQGEMLSMDFPAQPPQQCETPEALARGLGKAPVQTLQAEDYIAVFDSVDDIVAIEPDHASLVQLDLRGVIATAPAVEQDFVVRFFCQKFGIPEDPVTGSAYTQLVPFWAERLGKSTFRSRQLSARGGDLSCELKGDRVMIAGTAVKYMEAEIEIAYE